ncbi:hypothetical protein [Hydrogenophaga sp. 2FB]|uniref:hypothetical protein n=1 Tax=Hydrogenophaga sp. 2FB TaxID=2502187 RepID=UPI0010F4CB50|nr:hypothetical protein [Hydrogenophaga sp. 2FB]
MDPTPTDQSPASLLKSIQATARSIEREIERLAKRAPPSPKVAEKDALQRRDIKKEIDRGLHELHCLAVELGIASPQPERYGEKRVAAGFGRHALEFRRAPRQDGAIHSNSLVGGKSEDQDGASDAFDADVLDSGGLMHERYRALIEGMSVSVDVSTGEADAGHRLFGTVCEVMDDPQSKHGVTLLIQDAEPNYVRAAAHVPEAQTPHAPKTVLQPQGTGPYDANRIAWELDRTALGDAHYGNALRVAKDMAFLDDRDRALLDRFATSAQAGTDHVELQGLANKVRESAKETWHE